MARHAFLLGGQRTHTDDEQTRSVVLSRSGLLDGDLDPEIHRWLCALLRDLECTVVAFSLFGARVIVHRLTSQDDPVSTHELPSGASLRRHLAAASGAPRHGRAASAYVEEAVRAAGAVVGMVSVVYPAARCWSEREQQSLADAAAAVSTEVALRLARAETERVQKLVASHNRVHDLIARAKPLEEVLVAVIESIEQYDPSVIGCVVRLDPATNTLHPGAGPSLPPDYLAAIDGVVIGPNVGTCGAAAWSGKLTITENIATDPKWAAMADFATRHGLGHCWSMPIKAPNDEVLGTLALYGPRPRRPLAEHLDLLNDWSRVAGIAIERHRALERLIHDAHHDGLTGLPNRRAVIEALEDAIQRVAPGEHVAVYFVDLDGLKHLNDTFGHDRADEMLREVGARLIAAVPDGGFVGRFGGDEFVVGVERVREAEAAGELGLALLDAISVPMPFEESTVVTASVGITLVASAAVDAREAIRESDAAMYVAKRSGRDRYAFYEGGQRVRTARRVVLSRELRGAEMRGETDIVFQPVFALSNFEVVGVEALLRWRSPTYGDVEPAEFVPIAEDTGAIIPLGAWVLRESCEILARVGADLGVPLELEVNVSARQLANPGFAQSVRQILAHAEFPADRLALEVNEAAVMRPDSVTVRTLRELDSFGVDIVLDNFGAGFSSLSWLKQHRFKTIKVDRSFVAGLGADERDEAIVAAIVAMAGALGSTVTAEGVEEEAHLSVLHALGCAQAQGFLLARPMSQSDLRELLATGRERAPARAPVSQIRRLLSAAGPAEAPRSRARAL